MEMVLERTALPATAGTIVDIAPIEGTGRSTWLTLAEDGRLARFDCDSLEWAEVAACTLVAEMDKPYYPRPRRRLHAAPGGDFAAVVNDRGQFGQIIDLRSGRETLTFNGGDYHSDQTPFAFTFAKVGGRLVAIHRTDWNRLDVSDPRSGELLTQRFPTTYTYGKEERPEHYLDYFHGELTLSPSGTQILDNGWVWGSEGVPIVWNLERWISANAWESEDGPTRQSFCGRESWEATWIDETRIAIGELDEDDTGMKHGTGIFAVALPGDERTAGARPARSQPSRGLSAPFSAMASGSSPRWSGPGSRRVCPAGISAPVNAPGNSRISSELIIIEMPTSSRRWTAAICCVCICSFEPSVTRLTPARGNSWCCDRLQSCGRGFHFPQAAGCPGGRCPGSIWRAWRTSTS
jgi:hypothetical protein